MLLTKFYNFYINQWYRVFNSDQLKDVPKLFVGSEIEKRSDNNNNHIRKEEVNILIYQANFLINKLGC